MKIPQISFLFQHKNESIKTTFLFLTIFLWSLSVTEARPLHLDYFNVSPHYRPLTAMEHRLDHLFRKWFRQENLMPPRLDIGLREASWLLAHRLFKKPLHHLPNRLVQAALWLVGNSDFQIRIFGMGFSDFPTLKKTLYRSLARKLAGQRPTHYGIAIARNKRGVGICMILFARRGVQLGPIPRWLPMGQSFTIIGRVNSGFSHPSLAIGLPDGRVQKFLLHPSSNGYFSLRWHPKQIGYTRFQFSIQDERGPWISNQLDLRVVPKKISWDALWKKDFERKQRELWMTLRKPKGRKVVRRWSAKEAATALWRIVNQHRRSRLLKPLKRDIRLDLLAFSHAKDMVESGFFGHTSPQKGSFGERLKTLRWELHFARENIVVAHSPMEAYELFLKSPSHRVNLFSPKPTLTGVGAAIHPSGSIYFVQIFAKP